MRGSVPQSHTSTQQWQSFELRMRRRRVERCVQHARDALAAGRIREAEEALAEVQALDPDNPDASRLADRVPLVGAQVRARRAVGRRAAAVAVLILLAAGLGWLWMRTPVPAIPSAEGLVAFNTPAAPPVEPAFSPAPSETGAPRSAEPSGVDEVLTSDSAIDDPPMPAAQALPAAPAVPLDTRVSPDPAPASQPAGTAGVRRQEPPAAAGRSGGGGTATLAAGRGAASDTYPASDRPATAAATPETVTAPERALERPNAPSVLEELPRVALDLSSAPVAPPEPRPAVTAPAPPAARETAASTVSHEGRVRAALNRYQAAYSELDAGAARAVWPSVDTRALARAFEGLTAQSVSLGQCDVQIRGAAATADCRGQARWTPRVGGGTQTAPRRWRFELAQNGEEWFITQATVR